MNTYKGSTFLQRCEAMKKICALCIPADGKPIFSFDCKNDSKSFVSYMKDNIFKNLHKQDHDPEVDNLVLPTTKTDRTRQAVCFCFRAHGDGVVTNTVANSYLEEIFGNDLYTLCGPVVVFYIGMDHSQNHKHVSANIATVEEFNLIVKDIKEAVHHPDKGVDRAEAFTG